MASRLKEDADRLLITNLDNLELTILTVHVENYPKTPLIN